ncbi:MAG: hypothetical protein R2867_43965 [Caldilineaceae bacterium]
MKQWTTTDDHLPSCEIVVENGDVGIFADFEAAFGFVDANDPGWCQTRHADGLGNREWRLR